MDKSFGFDNSILLRVNILLVRPHALVCAIGRNINRHITWDNFFISLMFFCYYWIMFTFVILYFTYKGNNLWFTNLTTAKEFFEKEFINIMGLQTFCNKESSIL